MTKITDGQLTEALTRVFQTYGYDGATLSRISDATGLQRASLYHRFPGGKEEMAKFVLATCQLRITFPNAGQPLGDFPLETLPTRQAFISFRSLLLDELSLHFDRLAPRIKLFPGVINTTGKRCDLALDGR